MASTDESHVELSLGPYLLGALSAPERVAVERHLAGCAPCRAEADELSAAVVPLALLPDEAARDIVAEFGIQRATPAAAPGTTGEPSTATASAEPVSTAPGTTGTAPTEPVSTAPESTGTASAEPVSTAPESTGTASTGTASTGSGTTGTASTGTGTGEPGSGGHVVARGRGGVRPAVPPAPGTRRPSRSAAGREWLRTRLRRPSRGVVGVGSLVVILFVSAAVFVGMATGGDQPAGRRADVSVTMAATADTGSGATLSAVAIGHDGGVTVRATVAGLHRGVAYQLYAVTVRGDTRVVAKWAGGPGTREVTGEIPVAVGDLSFFTVARADGTPVVSAAVPRTR